MALAGPIDERVRSLMASIRIDIGKALDDAEDLAQAVLLGRDPNDPQTNDCAKLAEAILLLVSIVRMMIER